VLEGSYKQDRYQSSSLSDGCRPPHFQWLLSVSLLTLSSTCPAKLCDSAQPA